MSYDFRLCLPQAGRSREEIATADVEEFGISDPVPAKEERKQRISAALIAHNPALEPFAFGFDELSKLQKITVEDAKKKYRHIEMSGPDGSNGIQITLFDDEASVTVPYWHQGAAARQVFEEIWRYLQIIEREGGFFTYDQQVGRVLDLERDFESSLGCYDRASRDIAEEFQVQRKKPWWQFWN